VDRLLSAFTDVRSGESGTALLLTLNVFLLLTAYYVIKPVREALILAGGGAEVKSYASAGQAVLLLIAVPLYASLASRTSRKRLITSVTLFFVACLVGFYVWGSRYPLYGIPTPYPQLTLPVGVVFFLWVGIFNLMVVAQFWSFANDLYTPEQGKRLFVIVAFGASSGAVAGSWLSGVIIEPLGVNQMLLVAGALLLATIGLVHVVDRRERERATADGAPAAASAPRSASGTSPAEAPLPRAAKADGLGGGGAFQLVLGNRYLLLIAFLMLFLNWVNTTGEYILGRVVKGTAEAAVASGQAGDLSVGQFIGRFYADFFFWVNILGLTAQLLLVSRILKYLGTRTALLFLPVIAAGGYLIIAFYPVLSAVRWAKTGENATDYSLNNTVRNVLFLPTTREQKYKAKQAIDTFFVRIGDLLSAGLVFLGTAFLSFETRDFALVNLGLVVVWLLLAVAIGREHRRLLQDAGSDGSTEPR
jgi:AAA family ATP:ADP antiporter